MRNGAAFQPQTLSMLKAVFDEVVNGLPPHEQTQERKTLLASRLLIMASEGEKDPHSLRTAAIRHLATVSSNTSRRAN